MPRRRSLFSCRPRGASSAVPFCGPSTAFACSMFAGQPDARRKYLAVFAPVADWRPVAFDFARSPAVSNRSNLLRVAKTPAMISKHMSLVLERQTSSTVETVNTRPVYVVVKQSIFTLTITSPHRIDGDIDCDLVYDMDGFKPVGYVSQKPLTFRVQQITSNTINIDCKLSVLSSQHEDLLFRVLVKLVVGGMVISSLYSHAIKSTSKADSHKKAPKVPPTQKTKRPKRDAGVSRERPNLLDTKRLASVAKENDMLLEVLKRNLSLQNNKLQTMEGCLGEVLSKLSCYDVNSHSAMVTDVLSVLTADQLHVLLEIASVIESASPIQMQLTDPTTNYVAYQEYSTYYTHNYDQGFI